MYRRFLALSLGFSLGLLICAIATVVYVYVGTPARYNVLVIGSDQRSDERARSDVLFIVSIPKSGREPVVFYSVPRDTLIQDDTYGMQKITHLYALGERPDDGKVLGNVDATTGAVEQLLDINVDATVEVTFASFNKIVNDLGGAVVGSEVLSGEEALSLIRDRFSGDRTDFSRQDDERSVMQSLLTKVSSPARARRLLTFFKDNNQARLDYKKLSVVRFGAAAWIGHRGAINLTAIPPAEASVPGSGQLLYTPEFGQELYYWVPDDAALMTQLQDLQL